MQAAWQRRRLAPTPLSLQGGAWPVRRPMVNAMKGRVDDNLARGLPAVIGGYNKGDDHFQLYP